MFPSVIDGIGVRKTGSVITLDYREINEISQTYATRVENVTPYLVNYYAGSIELNPSSDIWIDTVKLAANTIQIEGNYTATASQLSAQGFDPSTGYGPVTWGSWADTWTGSTTSNSSSTAWQGNNLVQTDTQTVTKTGTSTRTGTRQVYKEVFNDTNLGNATVSSQIIPYMRSRNIEFISKRLKPSTQVYAFFDGHDVGMYVIPKLLEITMTSGSFQVGETVSGTLLSNTSISYSINFRVASQNHKYGPYSSPTDTYTLSPYDRTYNIPADYSTTSILLNVDTSSLSDKSQNTFYGSIQPGMTLTGTTSGAQAVINDVRLFTDSTGVVIGSFFIPNPNVDINPHFQTGTGVFRITSSAINTNIPNIVITSAEQSFQSSGTLNQTQENILSVRNIQLDTQTQQESKSSTSTSSTVVGTTVVGTTSPPTPSPYSPPPPIPGQRTFVPITYQSSPNYDPTQVVLGSIQQDYINYLGRIPDSITDCP